jgi:glucose-6-phosphate isomerase
MMDLQSISGIPMQIDQSGALIFDPELIIEESRARVLDELTEVYLDQEACQGSQPAYWMYNGVLRRADLPRLTDLPVRYELTLFPDMTIGRERVKTLGHIHAPDPVSGIDFPEICEVLVGTAHFLFQKLDLSGPSAPSAFFVEVKAGEKMVIPPGYEHLTINPNSGPMLFSDVVTRGLSGIYNNLRAAHGGAYLEVVENSSTHFIQNPAYTTAAPLRKASPKAFPALHLQSDQPLYQALLETRAEYWPFLWDPTCFQATFPDLDSLFQFEPF